MSVFPSETVRAVAEAARFPAVGDEVCQVLAADLEYRLREIAQDAAKFTRHARRRRMTTDDVNAALRVRNVEPVYGYPSGSHSGSVDSLFKRAKESDVFYIPDKVKPVREIIGAPLPSMPAQMTFTSHWLAIEGVQPTIPQNPPVHTEATATEEEPATKAPKLEDAETQAVEIKALQKHTLSREQQMLFQFLTEYLLSSTDESVTASALGTLANDPGLHQLIPFFIEFISTQTRENASDPRVIDTVVSMVEALVKNPNVYLEPYLHQIVPVVATCVVTKKLNSSAPQHLALRSKAAAVAKRICSKYNARYHDLQPRVLKVFQDVLKRRRSLLSYYGAVNGLATFGPRVVNLYLVDVLPEAMRLINFKRRHAATHALVVDAIKEAVVNAYTFLVLKGNSYNAEETKERFVKLEGVVPGLKLPVQLQPSTAATTPSTAAAAAASEGGGGEQRETSPASKERSEGQEKPGAAAGKGGEEEKKGESKEGESSKAESVERGERGETEAKDEAGKEGMDVTEDVSGEKQVGNKEAGTKGGERMDDSADTGALQKETGQTREPETEGRDEQANKGETTSTKTEEDTAATASSTSSSTGSGRLGDKSSPAAVSHEGAATGMDTGADKGASKDSAQEQGQGQTEATTQGSAKQAPEVKEEVKEEQGTGEE